MHYLETTIKSTNILELQELNVLQFFNLSQSLQDPNSTNDKICVFNTGQQGTVQ